MPVLSKVAASSMARVAVALVGGAVYVGSLDLVYACGYWWLLHGVPPGRILQVIASGVLGRRSFDGGIASVSLGLLLQYAISFVMVGAYYVVSGWMPALIRRAIWIYGALYGLWLYVAMNDVVVPLSAAAKGSTIPSWVVGSIVESVLLIGVPIAWIARWARNPGG
ncbi:hypothetical protein ABQJ54_17745 [Rhodanobacter sp. Si-c]|uniref:DUF1440 domain-containing protein n=1 Tax=Rhodanobacter lycopersici TaxID=3162487 RepID=A0ABV3QIC8_9GAMM